MQTIMARLSRALACPRSGRSFLCLQSHRSHAIRSQRARSAVRLTRSFDRTFKPARSVLYRGQARAAVSQTTGSEVEIKLRLADKAAHDKVAQALSAAQQATHEQENFFFDGSKQELTSSRSVLRCRFYNIDKRALLTCKGKQELVGGVGRGTELEIDIDPIKARDLLLHPDKLLQLRVDFVDELCGKLGVASLVCLGGFKNVRKDFSWEGFKLELDETQFDWGTVYEIEVETEEPEKLKEKLEAFLKEHSVQYAYSTVTKFHNFVSRTLE